jgi:hypothetical protein
MGSDNMGGGVLWFLVVFLFLCVQRHWDHGPNPAFDGTRPSSCSVLKGSAVITSMGEKEVIFMDQEKNPENSQIK